jgi:hypothetical protein
MDGSPYKRYVILSEAEGSASSDWRTRQGSPERALRRDHCPPLELRQKLAVRFDQLV